MFSVFHRIDTHRSVPVPWGTDIDQVDVIPLTYFFPFHGSAGVKIRIVLRSLQTFFYFFNSFGADVTKCFYFHAFDIPYPVHSSRTTHAEPDESRSEEHTSELQSRGHLVC